MHVLLLPLLACSVNAGDAEKQKNGSLSWQRKVLWSLLTKTSTTRLEEDYKSFVSLSIELLASVKTLF